ncbi:MAG: hypothetical protein ACO3ZD_09305 [Cyanobium sp.]
MSPSLICLDQQHPLRAGIAARFGLGVGSLDEGWQGDGLARRCRPAGGDRRMAGRPLGG